MNFHILELSFFSTPQCLSNFPTQFPSCASSIVRWWYPQSKPRLLKLLDTVADWKNKFFEKFGNRFHVTALTFRDDDDASRLENTLDDVNFESKRDD